MRRRMFAAGIAAFAIAVSTMIATMSAATADTVSNAVGTACGGPTPNAKLDAMIRVDESQNKIVATLRGVGKQVYDCAPGATTYTFREPMAGLFTTRGLPAGLHGKGPFWDDFDGSRVLGAKIKGIVDPVDKTKNVDWLLLGATPDSPPGSGVLSNVTFIQRTDTHGGQPPASCGAPTVSVDYTAFYVFWAKK